MASEITMSGGLSYEDADNVTQDFQIANVVKSVSTLGAVRIPQTAPITSAAALNMGGITAPGYVLIQNKDPTNYVDVLTGTGGVLFARLDPDTLANGTGGFCLLKLSSGAQAPFVLANTAPCVVDALICHA